MDFRCELLYTRFVPLVAKVKYESQGLLGLANACKNCFRSTLGFTATHDTRTGLPFPADGGMQTFNAQFNGGPLGGTAAFQRYTTELRSYAPIGRIGGSLLGSEPMMFVVGLSARAGAVFGNTGPFFYSQSFSVGGTQYGEQLRGYDEFSITPTDSTPCRSDPGSLSSFGNAFSLGRWRASNHHLTLPLSSKAARWKSPRIRPDPSVQDAGFGVAT